MKISKSTHCMLSTEKNFLPNTNQTVKNTIGYMSLKARCPNCGARLWQNRIGIEWCLPIKLSKCGWSSIKKPKYETEVKEHKG